MARIVAIAFSSRFSGFNQEEGTGKFGPYQGE
jgi:hypothetical protein